MKIGIILKCKKKKNQLFLKVGYTKRLLDVFSRKDEIYVICWKDITKNLEVKKSYFYNKKKWLGKCKLKELVDILYLIL